MVALLKKDFLTSRYIYTVITLIVVVVMLVMMKINPIGALIIATMGSVLIPVIVNKFTATEEMRKNYDMLMNSFPVKRSDVVISKYMYYLILHFLTGIILQGIVILSNRGDSSVLLAVLIAQCIAFLYYILLIGLPNFIYYHFDYDVATKYSMIITFVVVYTPMILMGIIDRINPNIRRRVLEYISAGKIDGFMLVGALFAIGILLYIIIIAASVMGYRRRDL